MSPKSLLNRANHSAVALDFAADTISTVVPTLARKLWTTVLTSPPYRKYYLYLCACCGDCRPPSPALFDLRNCLLPELDSLAIALTSSNSCSRVNLGPSSKPS